MLIALACLKASPGVTTAALAVAAMWQGPQRVAVLVSAPEPAAAEAVIERVELLLGLDRADGRERGIPAAGDASPSLG